MPNETPSIISTTSNQYSSAGSMEKKHHEIEVRTEQVQDMLYPEATPPVINSSWPARIKRKVTTREGWIGNYDYAALCMPRIPFVRTRKSNSPFYGPNDSVPILLCILMGLQHFLAVVGGIISPTIILTGAGSNALNLDQDTRQYLISASFIVSGLMSFVQIIRFKVPRTRYYIGAGLLQITGVSFANLPAAQAVVGNMYKSGFCPTQTLSDGSTSYLPCPDAYGAILGTQMICALLTIAISFLPPRAIRRMFPKIVTGIVLLVIGSSLLTSGMENWAGGTGPCMDRPSSGEYMLCPNTSAPNAQVWGGPVNFALGASVFFTIILLEIFGSVFVKNVSVVIGLVVGCIIAACVGMFDQSSIDAAPAATFLWVKTFKLSVYGPGIIPFLFVYLDMSIECLGDLTAACDVSGMAIQGEVFEQRCQGGLLADGLSGIISGLCTSLGVVTFSQNNGVIAVTRCANRYAGVVTAFLLIIFGIFSKISAAFLAIPSPLIGGMTVFLFASVATSGVRILGYLDWTRRDRVIVAASLAIALGVALVPDWFENVMPTVTNEALQGFYDAISTVVSTGYIMAGILSILLNQVLPYEQAPPKEPQPAVGGADRIYRDEEEAEADTLSAKESEKP